MRINFGPLRDFRQRRAQRSDVARWSDNENFHDNWNVRTEQLAGFVTPGERVLEFGAGMLALAKYLPEGSEHIATDIVSRGPGTLVCDLNDRSLPKLPAADVALFSGVLEYVYDLPRALGQIADLVPAIICSYATVDENPTDRLGHGWVNDYTEVELVSLIESLGYGVTTRQQWKRQILFRFDR